jgi:hypothetical protein
VQRWWRAYRAERIEPRLYLLREPRSVASPLAVWLAVLNVVVGAVPGGFSPLGARVETALRERLAETPSFVAFEGYDTVAVLADVLRAHGADRARIAESWPRVAVEGTRGQIQFSRTPGISVWQWAWAPVQVADRDPAEPGRFRILHASRESTDARPPRPAEPRISSGTAHSSAPSRTAPTLANKRANLDRWVVAANLS